MASIGFGSVDGQNLAVGNNVSDGSTFNNNHGTQININLGNCPKETLDKLRELLTPAANVNPPRSKGGFRATRDGILLWDPDYMSSDDEESRKSVYAEACYYLAIRKNQFDERSIRIIFEHGAKKLLINLPGKGETILHQLAALKKVDDDELCHSLIGAIGVDPQDCEGNTPLMWALKANNYEMVKCLINSGASVKFVDGRTVLHYAAAYCSESILRMLSCPNVTNYIDVDQRDFNGQTAWDLFVACSYGNWCEKEPGSRCPVVGEKVPFAWLFKAVQNKSLGKDERQIEQVLKALTNKDITASCSHLDQLGKRKSEIHDEEFVSWHSGVKREIQAGNFDFAEKEIKEKLKEIENRHKKDLFDEDKFDPWRQEYLRDKELYEYFVEAERFF